VLYLLAGEGGSLKTNRYFAVLAHSRVEMGEDIDGLCCGATEDEGK